METLKDRRDTLFRKFTMKSLLVKEMNKILTSNTKTHNMDTRNIEQYKVQNANTERFSKSSGIQIQHLINSIK